MGVSSSLFSICGVPNSKKLSRIYNTRYTQHEGLRSFKFWVVCVRSKKFKADRLFDIKANKKSGAGVRRPNFKEAIKVDREW